MATQIQAQVVQVLETLGFEYQPAEGKIVGGPTKLRAVDEALDGLRGKIVTVDSDGSVTID